MKNWNLCHVCEKVVNDGQMSISIKWVITKKQG